MEGVCTSVDTLPSNDVPTAGYALHIAFAICTRSSQRTHHTDFGWGNTVRRQPHPALSSGPGTPEALRCCRSRHAICRGCSVGGVHIRLCLPGLLTYQHTRRSRRLRSTRGVRAAGLPTYPPSPPRLPLVASPTAGVAPVTSPRGACECLSHGILLGHVPLRLEKHCSVDEHQPSDPDRHMWGVHTHTYTHIRRSRCIHRLCAAHDAACDCSGAASPPPQGPGCFAQNHTHTLLGSCALPQPLTTAGGHPLARTSLTARGQRRQWSSPLDPCTRASHTTSGPCRLTT
jgi:hypothetical protein